MSVAEGITVPAAPAGHLFQIKYWESADYLGISDGHVVPHLVLYRVETGRFLKRQKLVRVDETRADRKAYGIVTQESINLAAEELFDRAEDRVIRARVQRDVESFNDKQRRRAGVR